MNFVIKEVMLMDYKFNFTENGGKTIIRSTSTTQGDGIFMRPLMVFMQGAMQAQEDINMHYLKKVIEENIFNYFTKPIEDSLELSQ